jgi:hypothetical protein
MSGINIYADAKHRHGVIDSQIKGRQNLMDANTALLDLKVSLDQLPIFFEAINRNQLAIKSIFPTVSRLRVQVDELLEHTNYVIEERNEEFLEKLRSDPNGGKAPTILKKQDKTWKPSYFNPDPLAWPIYDSPTIPIPTAQCQATIGGTVFFPVLVPDECMTIPTRERSDGTVEIIPHDEHMEMLRKKYEQGQL